MKIAHKAYIAGIIDGEGTVGIWKSNTGVHSMAGRSPSYILRMSVKMTDEGVIKWLAHITGVKYWSQFNKRPGNHKPWIYQWTFTGRKAARLIREIYPYLIVKQKQCDVALEFIKTLQRRNYFGVRLNHKTVVARELLRRRMQALNKRGR